MDFKLKDVKKEYSKQEIENLQDDIEEFTEEKKKDKWAHELETLKAILAAPRAEDKNQIVQARILEIKRAKVIGWSTIEAIKQKKELEFTNEEWLEVQAVRTAELQEKLLKAQIKAAKKPQGGNRGRGSFRGRGNQRGGRGGKKD